MINKTVFLEIFDSLNIPTKVSLWNTYARENASSDEIYINDEEFFEVFFKEKPMEAVRAATFGAYDYCDDYVWFNGYGNLASSKDTDDMPIDSGILYDYFSDNENLLEEYTDFDECFEEEE